MRADYILDADNENLRTLPADTRRYIQSQYQDDGVRRHLAQQVTKYSLPDVGMFDLPHNKDYSSLQ